MKMWVKCCLMIMLWFTASPCIANAAVVSVEGLRVSSGMRCWYSGLQ